MIYGLEVVTSTKRQEIELEMLRFSVQIIRLEMSMSETKLRSSTLEIKLER